MSQPADGWYPARNYLLAALPPEEYTELLPRLEIVLPRFKEVLYEPNESIQYVYFPINGVISLVITMANGTMAEIATVGNEGMVGLPVFLEAVPFPGRALSQIPGNTFRLKAEVFNEIVGRSSAFQRVLHRYTQALFTQVAQSAACNRFHPIEKRCARWLLMTCDRVGSDEFRLTQEFLAQMLSVRRASVSEAAAMLQQTGLIRYNRGNISVADRAGLQAASCECYETVRREFSRLIGTTRS